MSGPPAIRADGVDPAMIAVVPFRVSSSDGTLEGVLREGVLDLLSPHLSGTPRMVDVGAMISAWRGVVASDETDLSEDQAVDLACTLGAGRVIVGSVVGSAQGFTANAPLLRVPGGDLVGDAVVEATLENLGSLAAGLSGQLLALEAGEEATRVPYLAGVPNDALRDLSGRPSILSTDRIPRSDGGLLEGARSRQHLRVGSNRPQRGCSDGL